MQMVQMAAIDKADTAWLLVSTVLVLLMTLPGIALFYAGLVRRKNVVNTVVAVFAVAAVVSLTWFALGYSLAFSKSTAEDIEEVDVPAQCQTTALGSPKHRAAAYP